MKTLSIQRTVLPTGHQMAYTPQAKSPMTFNQWINYVYRAVKSKSR